MASFSRRTVIAAIDVFKVSLSQAEFSSLLTDFGPYVYQSIGSGSAEHRAVELKQFVDRNPQTVVDEGILEDVLVERALGQFPRESHFSYRQPVMKPEMERLKRLLEQDGFTIDNGKLLRALPVDLGLPAVQSELFQLLEKHQMRVARGHLDQALENHARGNWAAANGQLRTFFDAALDEIAVKIDANSATLGSGQPRRAKLASWNFLSVQLNEWGDDGKGFINGLVKRLHPQGAHPGLSDDEDSTFRLHTVLLTVGLLLRRFDRGAQ